MFDLSGGSDHGRLPVGLHRFRTAGRLEESGHHHVGQLRGHVQDGRPQVLHEPLASPRVGDHRHHSEQEEGWFCRSATLDTNLLDVADHLPDLQRHQATSSVKSVNWGMTSSVNLAMLSIAAPCATPGKLDHTSSFRRFSFSFISWIFPAT